jgi:hypothetical protein
LKNKRSKKKSDLNRRRNSVRLMKQRRPNKLDSRTKEMRSWLKRKNTNAN